MGKVNIEGCVLSPLKRIPKAGGSILHALKSSDVGYAGFGEVYFSSAEPGIASDWKRHKSMTLNLIVPVGEIKFVLFDQRKDSSTFGNSVEVILGTRNYSRLTIPPGIWLAFKGIAASESFLANVANLEHDPLEAERVPLNTLYFEEEGDL